MRDARRIAKVLSKIREIWEQSPDLRLMQLLGNAFPGGRDAYYVEDAETMELLDKTYPRSQTG